MFLSKVTRCRKCQTNITTALRGKYKQAFSEKAGAELLELVFVRRVRRQVLGHKAQSELIEVREKFQQLEEKISSVQFEGMGEEGKPEEFGKMEVDEEAVSKKKLDQGKKELHEQLRELRNSQKCRKVRWSSTRTSGSRSCTVCKTKKKQCQKDMAKRVGDREKARNEIHERHAHIDECNQKNEQTSRVESELDKEIRILRAEDAKGETVVRRSPTDGASIQPWWSSPSRWEQYRLGSNLFLFREISAEYSSISQRQPLECTCQKEEKEETKVRRRRGKERRATNWVNQRRGTAMRGFPVAFDPSTLSRNAGAGEGDEFYLARGGGGERCRHFRRERDVDKSRSGTPPFFLLAL